MKRLAAFLLAVASAGALAALEVPKLERRVTDLAGLFTTTAVERMETELADLEADTGAQVAVLTVPSLEGEALEDYSLRVAETWGLGRADRDNGLLILIARDDRKIRIEVGYGLEGVVPDVLAGRIIDNAMKPAFRQGDFSGGTLRAVELIGGLIRQDPEASAALQRGGRTGGDAVPILGGLLIFAVVVGTFSLTALFSEGCGSWFLYLFLSPFYFAFPGAFLGPGWGLGLAAAWLIGFPILRSLIWHTDAGKRFRTTHPKWTTWTTTGSSWSGGGGFSGGFSGGGGSFGGGGASGGW